MKRISTTFISALVALTFIAASAATPAQAGSKERRIVAGILLGALGGAIIASEINRSKKKKNHYGHRRNPSHVYNDDIHVKPRKHRRVRHNSRRTSWERHVRRCQRNYRSYDEFSDTWIDRRGRERICRL
ncbi:MAG: BA14K family protein [Rhizobiaceae bacterium]